MPLPGTQVFSAGWSDHHRPTATATMTSRCAINRSGGEGTTGPGGDWEPAAPTTVYTGPCRMQALATSERLDAGEDQLTARRYLTSLPHDADRIELGDTVELLDAVDEEFVGMQLQVVDVRYGSEQWQRDLITEEVDR